MENTHVDPEDGWNTLERSNGRAAMSNPGGEKDANSEERAPIADDGYLHGTRLAAIVISLILNMFLVALDNMSSCRVLA